MVLTQKVKETIGGYTYKVFEVTTLTGGTTGNQSISLGAIDMNEVIMGVYTPTAVIMTSTSTAVKAQPVLSTWTTSGGGDLVISAIIASSTPDTGILEVWGH